jgi:hypothetical protein
MTGGPQAAAEGGGAGGLGRRGGDADDGFGLAAAGGQDDGQLECE